MQPVFTTKTQIRYAFDARYTVRLIYRFQHRDGLDAQTATAFGTTSTNYGTTATRAHPHEEAVGALAAHDRRLISAFHGNIPLKMNPQLHLFDTNLSSGIFMSACG